MEVTAFILAGGKSTRMGRDKAALTLNGRMLLTIMHELAWSVTERVRTCGPRDRFGADAIEDIYPDCGPLGGIHAALAASETELNVILAVDIPFVRPDFLRFLVEEAERGTAVVTVPYTEGRFQPLCAVYRREFGALAEQLLQKGRHKIERVFGETSVQQIGEDELTKLAFDVRMFDNLNTPEDFERAQQRT
ncbi:MAG: molybdenum cofactor guanylyltransferase [Terriglobales bacterium]